MYFNLADASDAKNYNVEISGSVLQTSLNTLTNAVNVNTLDITTLDASVSSGFLASYTKTESDARYNKRFWVVHLIYKLIIWMPDRLMLKHLLRLNKACLLYQEARLIVALFI